MKCENSFHNSNECNRITLRLDRRNCFKAGYHLFLLFQQFKLPIHVSDCDLYFNLQVPIKIRQARCFRNNWWANIAKLYYNLTEVGYNCYEYRLKPFDALLIIIAWNIPIYKSTLLLHLFFMWFSFLAFASKNKIKSSFYSAEGEK